jgi:PilZ domain
MQERRSHSRQLTCVPASLESRWSADDLALIRDASVSGARLLTGLRLEPNEEVLLNLFLEQDSEKPRQVRARVVRCEPTDPARADVWAWQIAVEFLESIQGYEEELEQLCRRQEQAGMLKR